MAGMEEFLTKKVGPAPVWVYAAGGGLLASVLFLKKKGAAVSPSGAPPGTDSTTGPYSPSPIVITTPGNMPDGTSSVNPNPNAPPNPPTTPPTPAGFATVRAQGSIPQFRDYDQANPGAGIQTSPSGGFSGYAPWGAGVKILSGPVPGPRNESWYQVQVGTIQGWMIAHDLLFSGGGGGASSVMKFVPSSSGGKVGRFSGKHAHSQFVSVGMGGGGHAGLSNISNKTGVPKVRLMALNRKHWQGQRHNGVIHIG